MATTTKMSVLLLVVVCFLAAATAGGAVQFKVVNAIQDEDSRRKFDATIGAEHAGHILIDATNMAWKTLGQSAASDRKDVACVTLSVEGYVNRGTFTKDGTIHLGGGYGTDVYDGPQTFDKEEVTGILYREVTTIWLFNGNGRADKGLLGGIAELVQMRSGHTPARWPEACEGAYWNELRPGVTAQFLQYVDTRHPGFVAKMARRMKTGYNDHYFVEITGKSANQLWKEYKEAASCKN